MSAGNEWSTGQIWAHAVASLFGSILELNFHPQNSPDEMSSPPPPCFSSLFELFRMELFVSKLD